MAQEKILEEPISSDVHLNISSDPEGLIEKGNLDPFNRKILKNPDGSVSTTSSFSFGEDGKEILIPSVINGKRLTNQQAIDYYHKTGQHLGKFKDAASADKYATDLHNRQEQQMFNSEKIQEEPISTVKDEHPPLLNKLFGIPSTPFKPTEVKGRQDEQISNAPDVIRQKMFEGIVKHVPSALQWPAAFAGTALTLPLDVLNDPVGLATGLAKPLMGGGLKSIGEATISPKPTEIPPELTPAIKSEPPLTAPPTFTPKFGVKSGKSADELIAELQGKGLIPKINEEPIPPTTKPRYKMVMGQNGEPHTFVPMDAEGKPTGPSLTSANQPKELTNEEFNQFSDKIKGILDDMSNKGEIHTVSMNGERLSGNPIIGSEKPPTNIPPDEPLIPGQEPPAEPPKQDSLYRRGLNLAKELKTIDLPYMTSAAFRQASNEIGTKNWFKAWGDSAKSFHSDEIYKILEESWNNNPLFKKGIDALGKPTKSYADEIGVKLSELDGPASQGEEQIRSNLAEKIPIYGRYVRASKRAFIGFLNSLRVAKTNALVDAAEAAGLNPKNDLVLGKNIGDVVNDATGKSPLRFSYGINKEKSFEKHAEILADVLWSPRNTAKQIRMLNPATYVNLDPFTRRQQTYGLLRSLSGWMAFSTLAELGGAQVIKDPNNSDFGKIKIGNTRIDPGAGMIQFLVLANRMKPLTLGLEGLKTNTGITPIDLGSNLLGSGGGGITSSTSNKFTPFGKGPFSSSRFDTAVNFAVNKTDPYINFAITAARANKFRPMYVGDKTIQLFTPMFVDDIKSVIKEHPELAPVVGLAGGIGLGAQTYDKGAAKPIYDLGAKELIIK